jgi:hypothetical protein
MARVGMRRFAWRENALAEAKVHNGEMLAGISHEVAGLDIAMDNTSLVHLL